MELTLHKIMLGLPLFQGVAKADMEAITERARLHFETLATGSKIACEGDRCTGFIILMDGTISSEQKSQNGLFTFTEFHSAPFIIQPEMCFGLNQFFTRTFVACSDVKLITISKEDVLNKLLDIQVFRINLLNTISWNAQKAKRLLPRQTGSTTKEKLIHLLLNFSEYPAGKKVLYGRMEDIAEHIDETRLNLSNELNRLKKEGLVELHRMQVVIPALENLLTLKL